MRCLDVTRELAVPTGLVDSAELNRHVASCPHCSVWARRARQFDRLWENTRVEAPDAAFDGLWSNVRRALDNPPEAAETRPSIASSRMRWRMAVAVLAPAAALLVAALLLFDRGDRNGLALGHDKKSPVQGKVIPIPFWTDKEVEVRLASLEIEPGQCSIFGWAGQEFVVEKRFENTSNAVSPDLDVLNALEGMAQ